MNGKSKYWRASNPSMLLAETHHQLHRHDEVSVREANICSLPRPLAPDCRRADEGCVQILFAAPGHRASAFSGATLKLTTNIPERVHRQIQHLIRCPLLDSRLSLLWPW